MKFCNKCGRKLIKKEKEGFDTKTGKRKVKLLCPSLLCEHIGTPHETKYNILTFREKCSRCGLSWFSAGDF